MRAGLAIILMAVVVAARLCHSSVLWADDTLPLAAAMELARGKTLYRDVWFDKPPLVAWIYLLWGARAGLALRLAGAAYVMAVAAAAWQFARVKWSARQGTLAAAFAAFVLTFGLPSAVIPLASDMLLVLPHFLAVYWAWRGREFWSGVAAGAGLLCSSKAVFVLLACALWQWRQTPLLLAGFALPNALALGWMWRHGSAAEYYRQVWQWGSIYASHTFVEHPVAEGLKRTANWIGFQAALVAGAAVALVRERDRKILWWIASSMAGVALGLRFFPRYYFLLLPAMTILAARGWAGSRSPRAWMALAALLAVPLVRFAPAHIHAVRGDSRDLAMDRDSRAAAGELRRLASPGDTLFVWGFRPDIFVDSGLSAGTRFLESQPISGVLADRHLFSNAALAAAFTAPNRRELLAARPTWVVDGLGPYNPALALSQQPELGIWLARYYHETAHTGFSILYRLR